MEWELGKSGSRRKELRKLDLDNVANVTLFITAFIGIWQIVFLLNVWPKVALPSPAMVSGTFEELIQDMTLDPWYCSHNVSARYRVLDIDHHWYWNWIGHGENSRVLEKQ